jgi:hypothetical protein
MNGMNRRSFLRCVAAGAGGMSLAALARTNSVPMAPTRGLSQTFSQKPTELLFRQVHLDYHTSPLITDVGIDFDPKEFVQILKESSVNSVTVFAKCHHGLSYYPTKVGEMHPHLKFDMLGQMIEACHKAGIRTPVYISAGWDEFAAENHPEWRVLDETGKPDGAGPLEAGWRRVCINTPYLDYLASQSEEVVKGYDVDGIFYDIMRYQSFGCFCPFCMRERDKLGLDSAKQEDRTKHMQMVIDRGLEKLGGLVRQNKPKALVFFNSRMRIGVRAELKHYTHLEIESLPGGAWGYTHFQFMSRYVRTLGPDFMGMTGRFHRGWGDFGTVRNQAALDYECFSMLAQGAKCSIGDQLHPRGRLNRAVYKRIGLTYRSVAEKEPWCAGAKAVAEIGLLANTLPVLPTALAESDQGATRMLSQLHHQFDVLDRDSDFSRYRVVILPDFHRLDAPLLAKVKQYVTAGGKLILSHESGLDMEGKQFALPDIGVSYEGPAPYKTLYTEVLKELKADLPDMEHMLYEPASAVLARQGTTLLARFWSPYFDRDYRHFSSHKQTPHEKPSEWAAVTQKGNIIYFAAPIFKNYARNSYAVDKQLFQACLARLLPQSLVVSEAPSTAQITVTEQSGRRILHVLHYPAERRTPDIDIVEDVIPLYNLKVGLRTDKSTTRVYLAPQKTTVKFGFQAPYTYAMIPLIQGHQMLVFE